MWIHYFFLKQIYCDIQFIIIHNFRIYGLRYGSLKKMPEEIGSPKVLFFLHEFGDFTFIGRFVSVPCVIYSSQEHLDASFILKIHLFDEFFHFFDFLKAWLVIFDVLFLQNLISNPFY